MGAQPCGCMSSDCDDNITPLMPRDCTEELLTGGFRPSTVREAMSRAAAAARNFDSAVDVATHVPSSSSRINTVADSQSHGQKDDGATGSDRGASSFEEERGGASASSVGERTMRYTSGLLSLLIKAYAKRGRPPPALCACVACPTGDAPSISADGNLVQSPAWEAWVQKVSSSSSHARNCEFSDGLPRLQRQVLT